MYPLPQCCLRALPLPEAASARAPQRLPGAAAATRPPADPLAGANTGRTPTWAPAPAPHCRGPRRGAHAAAPPPGEGPARTHSLMGTLPLLAWAHRSLSLQGTVVFTTHVPALGRYAFLLHGYQPAHPTFAVEVLINGGRVWQGEQRGWTPG